MPCSGPLDVDVVPAAATDAPVVAADGVVCDALKDVLDVDRSGVVGRDGICVPEAFLAC